MSFWLDHLNKHKIENQGIKERFGHKFIRFSHPSGLEFEVMEDPADKRVGWETPEIKMDTSVRGFFGTVLSVRETTETERFFVDALGFKNTGKEGPYTRLEVGPGGAAKTIVLHHEPEKPQGSWIFGEGTPHHVAMNVPTDEDLMTQKGIYDELGYTDCSEVKDRNYFHSIYCRCPGGILVECAATAEGGFARDEPADQLGTSLLLPPWFEEKRAEIVAMLEPIQVPEYNGPVAKGAAAPGVGPGAAAPKSGVNMSRRDATFIGGDK